MKRIILTLALFTAFAAAQVKLEGPPEPKLIDAKVRTVSAASGLGATIDKLVSEQTSPAWIGYAVPTMSKPRLICCFDYTVQARTGCCTGCRLENHDGSFTDSTGGTCVKNDPPTHIFVFVRAEAGAVTRIRPYTPDCALDAGGLSVIWLQDVKPAESVAWLEKQLNTTERRNNDNALQAIALHADPSALRTLERMMQPAEPRKFRDSAAFWVAQSGGHEGFLLIQKYIRNDSDDRFREQLTFDLTQTDEPEAVGELVRAAKMDDSSRVRGQAIFWLAQKASREAAKAITDMVENDPDTQVKKKAIFAISQMPRDESVPLLIKYASTHPNPVIRKEAIFWLGETHDPRAVDYLEKLVTGGGH